ncbi:MAG: type II secretion system protein [Verrucomicrobiales bacterium]|nr:type II secretion system protein [Verrucomicrobiales bacterium]
MKLNSFKKQAGLTLIEVTLVIAVLLGLISVLFIGVGAYKEGSNRAKCILNITNVQKAVRSYQNMYEGEVGDNLAYSSLYGEGRMLASEPICPSNGGASYTAETTIPETGTAYITCSYDVDADTGVAGNNAHAPSSTDGW